MQASRALIVSDATEQYWVMAFANRIEAALRGVIGRGWVSVRQGQIALTDAGHRRAELLASAHELWEQYLRQEVGLADDHLHDPAEWVEHFLDENRIEELKASLKSPGSTSA